MTEVVARALLTEECGHHCGVVTTGKVSHIGHCHCNDCHGSDN